MSEKLLNEMTSMFMATSVGQEILAEMNNEPRPESWINDIDAHTGKVFGRLELFSGRYERVPIENHSFQTVQAGNLNLLPK
jgi:hypothetical protein